MNFPWIIKTGIGQDSHAFVDENTVKPCIIGGVLFENSPGLAGNSDADVVLHALCNAISSVTGYNILGDAADKLCLEDKVLDSKEYVKLALTYLKENQTIMHLSFSVEGLRPHFKKKIVAIKESIANLLSITVDQIGFTATTGEGLTSFGLGKGLMCFCSITTIQPINTNLS